MDDLSAQRTLVKSPPELWAEISDLESLARRLGEFGEIRITQLEPETTVAWEGDRIRGTVTLMPSGWGTKVTLAAELDAVIVEEVAVVVEEVVVEEEVVVVDEPVVEAAPEVEPEAESVVEAEPVGEAEPVKVGFWKRLFGRKATVAEEPEAVVVEPEAEPEPEPVLVVEPEPEPEPVVVEPEPEPEPVMDGAAAQAVLVSVLDALGAAHHRPFSRG